MDVDEELRVFYDKCLEELKARDNYSDTFIPMMQRYVTLTAMLRKLNVGIVEEEMVIEFVNKNGHKNEMTSPKWRMFLLLNKEATALARELQLSPSTAPVSLANQPKVGIFDLTNNMKLAK